MPPLRSSSRIPQLDALRGLAACSVVISHYLIVLKNSTMYGAALPWVRRLAFTPLRLLWAGHSAVVFFFVLSGFVLFLLLEKRELPFRAYVGKRITRLYIPYVLAIALGVLGEALADRGTLTGLGAWINQFWSRPVTLPSLLNHLFFLGAFNSNRYDFTIWTLVQEMRISLLFPLIYLLVQKVRWWTIVLACLALSASAIAMRWAAFSGSMRFDGFAIGGQLTAYALTLEYVPAFAMGALLACYRGRLRRIYGSLSVGARVVLAVVALGLYIYGSQIGAATGLHMMTASDWPILGGAILLVIISAFDGHVSRWLRARPLLYLGRNSYSLYLFHPLILLAALHLFYDTIPLGVLLAATFIVTFVITDIAYRSVERPAVHLSRWCAGVLTRKVRERQSSAGASRQRNAMSPSRDLPSVDEEDQ